MMNVSKIGHSEGRLARVFKTNSKARSQGSCVSKGSPWPECLHRVYDDMLLEQCADVCYHRQSSLPPIAFAAALCHAAMPALFTPGHPVSNMCSDRMTRCQLCHYHLGASHHLNAFEYAATRFHSQQCCYV